MGNVLTSRGFQLVPDALGALQKGFGLRQQFEQQQQLGRQNEARQLSGQLLGPQRLSPDEENQQLAQLFTTDPNAGLAVQKQLGLDTASKRRQAADFAFKAEGLPLDQQNALINQRAKNVLNRGGDPSDTLSLLQLGPEDRSRALRTIQLLDLSNEQRLKIAQGGSLAGETASQREFNNLLKIAQDPKSTELEVNSARRKLGDLANVSTTAAERIAEDEDLSKKVAESQAEITTAKKLAEGAAKLTSKTITKGFDAIGNINKNILNIDRALSALERGAGTGAAEQFLPSIKAASVELNQIQSELALDVVGATTFGALSEGELKLARDVALPTGLDEPALKDWLGRKKIAQTKYRDYLNQQIQFLDGGGTVPEFLASQQTGQRGEGTIMVDAQGNRARVFADGTFEEL